MTILLALLSIPFITPALVACAMFPFISEEDRAAQSALLHYFYWTVAVAVVAGMASTVFSAIEATEVLGAVLLLASGLGLANASIGGSLATAFLVRARRAYDDNASLCRNCGYIQARSGNRTCSECGADPVLGARPLPKLAFMDFLKWAGVTCCVGALAAGAISLEWRVRFGARGFGFEASRGCVTVANFSPTEYGLEVERQGGSWQSRISRGLPTHVTLGAAQHAWVIPIWIILTALVVGTAWLFRLDRSA